jgi:hypothetical protein
VGLFSVILFYSLIVRRNYLPRNCDPQMSHCKFPGGQMNQYRRTRTETCPSTTLSDSNLIPTLLVSKQGLQGQKTAINHMTYGMTSPWRSNKFHITRTALIPYFICKHGHMRCVPPFHGMQLSETTCWKMRPLPEKKKYKARQQQIILKNFTNKIFNRYIWIV